MQYKLKGRFLYFRTSSKAGWRLFIIFSKEDSVDLVEDELFVNSIFVCSFV